MNSLDFALERLSLDSIVLNDNQVKNYNEIVEIWKGELAAINNSVMGTGKTIVLSKLSVKFSNFLVIGPASLEWIWLDTGHKYNFKVNYISYETLSSSVNNTPKHDFLTRNDIDGEIIFKVTPSFKKLVDDGLLLAADEFHRIKKKNTRYLAFKALCDYMSENKNHKSKICLMSGSPFCEKDHPSNTLQMINIIKSNEMFKYDKVQRHLVLKGMKELINYCKNHDLEKTNEILDNNELTNKNIYDVAFLLYVNIVQKRIVSSMPPLKLPVKLMCYNAYFNMNEKEAEKLKSTIGLLKSAVSSKETIEELAITTVLRMKQIDKVCIYIRIANILLNQNKTNKVCIFFDYDEPIFQTEVGLKHHKPIVLTGKINKIERPSIIKKFQENNSDCRLLIINTSVGCEGIDLDDVHGTHKRYNLVEPSFYILRMHQLTRRFYRFNTKSDTIVYFVYGNCGVNETNIINSIARKTIIMKETLQLQVSEGIVFPADHEYIQEKSCLEDSYEMIPLKKIEPTETFSTSGVYSKKISNNIKTRRIVLASNVLVNNIFDF